MKGSLSRKHSGESHIHNISYYVSPERVQSHSYPRRCFLFGICFVNDKGHFCHTFASEWEKCKSRFVNLTINSILRDAQQVIIYTFACKRKSIFWWLTADDSLPIFCNADWVIRLQKQKGKVQGCNLCQKSVALICSLVLSAVNMQEQNLFHKKLKDGECHQNKAPGMERSERRTTFFLFHLAMIHLYIQKLLLTERG